MMGGRPIGIGRRPLRNTALAFEQEVVREDWDRPLTVGVARSLFLNTTRQYDRETGGLCRGPLSRAGHRTSPVGGSSCRVGRVRRMHSEARAMEPGRVEGV